MPHALFRAIDAVSHTLFRLSFVATLTMIGAILIEVWSRYVLGAPTLWVHDISYMTNGAIIMLGAAWVLRQDQHVRVDIIDGILGRRGRHLLDGVFFLVAVTPVTAVIAWFAMGRAWRSFITGEVEMVSPWQPVIWPFQAVLAVGMAALALQSLSRGLSHIAATRTREVACDE